MSADDCYSVKYDKSRYGWIAVHGFASDSVEGVPIFARGDEKVFATQEEATDEAFRLDHLEPTEYGVLMESRWEFEALTTPEEYIEWAEKEIESLTGTVRFVKKAYYESD